MCSDCSRKGAVTAVEKVQCICSGRVVVGDVLCSEHEELCCGKTPGRQNILDELQKSDCRLSTMLGQNEMSPPRVNLQFLVF